MAEPGTSEYVTAMARRRMKVLQNAIENNNVLPALMKEYGGWETDETGRSIIEPFLFDENDTFKRYFGGETLNVGYNPTITGAEFEPKQFAGAVVITGREERMNQGPEAVFKLMKSRFQALELTLENNLNADMISDGTSDNGKQIGGLKHIVSKTPTTGTVGGIDRSSTAGAVYRNFKFDTTTDSPASGTATSAANITNYWDYCVINTTRGTDRIKVFLAGQMHFRLAKQALQSIQRIVMERSGVAKAGFPEFMYDGIPVVLGGGVSFGGQTLVQSDATYGLNTRYIKMRIYRGGNMEPLPELQSLNQDSKVQLVVFMGNMTSSVPKLQFVHFDS